MMGFVQLEPVQENFDVGNIDTKSRKRNDEANALVYHLH